MRSTIFLALGLVACGGATDTDLFNGSPQPGTNASVQKDTSVTPTPDSGVTDTGSTPDTSIADTSVPDTSMPPTSKIQCGNSMCNVGTEVCCRSGFQNFTYACVANKGQCNNQGSIVLECSKAENCPNMGDVCCAALQLQGQANIATGTRCTAANQCVGNNNVIVCDPAAMNNCPNGGNCSISTITLPNYDICK